ncbi:Uncharacterised protein [Bacillus freudenreichii]|nr:Uncharacterised protein [Bacillus freudenreichii]
MNCTLIVRHHLTIGGVVFFGVTSDVFHLLLLCIKLVTVKVHHGKTITGK